MGTAAVSRDEFNQVKEDVEKHDHWIYGNGNPGAKTDIEMLKEYVASGKKRDAVLISAGITLMVGVLIWLLTVVLPKLVTII